MRFAHRAGDAPERSFADLLDRHIEPVGKLTADRERVHARPWQCGIVRGRSVELSAAHDNLAE